MSDADWWAFTRVAGRYVADIGVVERAVLADLADQVIDLLGGALGSPARDDPGGRDPLSSFRLTPDPVDAPTDPAVHRLLPDGSRADPDVAAEYRRLTEGDLRETKIGNLRRLRISLATGPVDVAPGDAPAVAAALTDIRLVVAERLGVRTEADADALTAVLMAGEGADAEHTDPDRDARVYLGTVSALLGVLLESLVELMLDELA